MSAREKSRSAAGIPRFFLYGEPPQAAGERFAHLETLDERSRPSHWNIRAHAHGDLHHLFLIAKGGGTMRAESADLAFEAPAFLVVPAAVVHGFTWRAETEGWVLTLSDRYLRDLIARESAFSGLFATPIAAPLAEARLLAEPLTALAAELSDLAPGHAAAVESHLLGALVAALRAAGRRARAPESEPGPRSRLAARFREALEARYRSDGGVEAYAGELGVTPAQLRAACLSTLGRSPLKLVQDRRLLEARRLLRHTDTSIAEVGYYLGFEDPAYFSRFFAKAAGCSPRAYRAQGRA